MYVKINLTKYTEIKNLSFAPETDITGDTLPINNMSLDIKTTNTIPVGSLVYLFDDLDQLWARYWIEFADIKDPQFVHVEAVSMAALLDRVKMDAVIYTSDTALSVVVGEIMTAILGSSWSGIISIKTDTALQSKTIKGYCPEQTARERLQWVAFAVNAYINQTFTEYTVSPSLLVPSTYAFELKEIDETTVVDIPMNKVYWRPTPRYNDYVTDVSVTKYTFIAGTPVTGEDYVTVDDTTYRISSQKVILHNSDAPASAAKNVVEVDGMYLVNTDNADDIASHLALIYFARTEVEADVIDNREFLPSQKVRMPINSESGAVGFIKSADFKFGLQAKATLKIIASSVIELGNLIIRYMYKGGIIGVRRYSFPVGTEYSIENQYVDKSGTSHRYVYRPKEQYATGTIVEGANINEQDYDIALHYYGDPDLLSIKSVSDIEWDSTDKEVEIN